MPEPLARSVLAKIAGTTASSAVGWIFAHRGAWGVFLPALSDDPAWPSGTTYLKTGGRVALPPVNCRFVEGDRTSGWVNRTGHPLSRPLLLHPVVTLLAHDAT
jgi:hypothetical protein